MEEMNFNQNTLKEDNELGHVVGLTIAPPSNSGIPVVGPALEPVEPVTEPVPAPVEPVTEPAIEIGDSIDHNRKSTLGELEEKVNKIGRELEEINVSDEVAESFEGLINQMFRKAICDITGLPEYIITDDVVSDVRHGCLCGAPIMENGRIVGHTDGVRPLYDDEVLESVLISLRTNKGKTEEPTINVPTGVIYSQEENSQSRSK